MICLVCMISGKNLGPTVNIVNNVEDVIRPTITRQETHPAPSSTISHPSLFPLAVTSF